MAGLRRFALMMVAGFSPAFSQAAPVVGEAAPAFNGIDTHGKKVALADYKGKIVVLEWSNHECPFVRKFYESGKMQELQKTYTGKGAAWITVISSAEGKQGHVDDAKANALTKERSASPTAVIRDPSGEIGKLYRASATPHMFVIDKNGTLAYAGAIDSIKSSDKDDIAKAENYVASAVEALLAGKPVATPASEPYGCSVKYGK
ncbi:MAG: redoxin domain-containing protein [Alphaproteobacteria bacterium]|nr:redoxin domain-containing protein [Alphaproteobacteria bacterium]